MKDAMLIANQSICNEKQTMPVILLGKCGKCVFVDQDTPCLRISGMIWKTQCGNNMQEATWLFSFSNCMKDALFTSPNCMKETRCLVICWYSTKDKMSVIICGNYTKETVFCYLWELYERRNVFVDLLKCYENTISLFLFYGIIMVFLIWKTKWLSLSFGILWKAQMSLLPVGIIWKTQGLVLFWSPTMLSAQQSRVPNSMCVCGV